jgi:hypothetical protein
VKQPKLFKKLPVPGGSGGEKPRVYILGELLIGYQWHNIRHPNRRFDDYSIKLK